VIDPASVEHQGSSGTSAPVGADDAFASSVHRILSFSARAVVAGAEPPRSWEPESADTETSMELKQLRAEVFARDDGCAYCRVKTTTMQVDSINDIHQDLDPANNLAADPICHGYHHLSELPDGAARVAYLPGLQSTDVNHLQRLAAIHLFEGTDQEKQDARDLVNWLASHSQYTKDAFGSASPSTFAAVLNRVDPDVRDARAHVFEGLSLVFNPTQFRAFAPTWNAELSSAHRRSSWPAFFQDVMRLSAQ
jgi:intracellular multiplication protein IcmJ